MQLEPMDPNIPSNQLGSPIPPNNQPIIAQSLVHTTPQQPPISSTIVFIGLVFHPFVA